MVETNPIINPVTGRQWDVNSLIEKLLELQDSLLQVQERNIMLTAQARELERIARDAEDLKEELTHQGTLLADKSRENKHLHQELSRMASVLGSKMQEAEDLKSAIVEIQHQLKTCQSERDLLAVMLTEAENAARQVRQQSDSSGHAPVYPPAKESGPQTSWLNRLKGRQS
ncbi:MAG: hypothetical protein HY711_02500 [Candidatus Melainabacteria bacterium]|nr:hypothetical protein [Candidatus Melainabacteria bacterium]